jgi:aryl-phospho-beta-D-glucosidase BglC (GH1 family)
VVTADVPESQWIQDWVTLAQRYAGNPTVIGADLHNEPHGPATWGDGNLEGAHDAPVRLSAPDKLVYSTHGYGPGVYHQKWFDAPAFPANLPGIWIAHWAFLAQADTAPVLVGEFGGRSVGSDEEGVWQRSLVDFLKRSNLSHTYWVWNPDSGDTGGILADDWSTLDQSKLAMLAGSPLVASNQAQASWWSRLHQYLLCRWSSRRMTRRLTLKRPRWRWPMRGWPRRGRSRWRSRRWKWRRSRLRRRRRRSRLPRTIQ